MLDALFLFSAAVGGATVVLRVVLMLFGVGDDHSFGSQHDIGPDDTSGSHSDIDAGTRLITIQGVAAFLMMFGLVGLALTREAGLAPIVAVPIALAAGFLSMWILARVFSAMMGLQSSGTLDLSHAVGREGVVYLTIRPETGGQVQLDVQGRQGVYEARIVAGEELATGRAVRVVGVRGSALVVEALPRT